MRARSWNEFSFGSIRREVSFFAICLFFIQLGSSIFADEPSQKDVVYGTVGDVSLRLDFYEPTSRRPERPLILWVHGGAWRSGSKSGVPISKLREQGFAIASVEYRLSPVAQFPAQIHDINAAIRFMRTHADRFELDADRFVIAGSSAGGHLAVLTAVSEGIPELAGTSEATPAVSTRLQGCVSFFGAGNLQTILAQSTPFGLNVRVPALQLLLGDQPDQKPLLAKLASPVEHIDRNDPPLWLYHGDQDPQMPINQSLELLGAYKKLGLPVQMEVVHGGKHGGSGFFTDEQLQRLGNDLWGSLLNGSSNRDPRNRESQNRNSLSSTLPNSPNPKEGKRAKTHELTRQEFNALPKIETFRSHPTDQFIVDWTSLRTGHPYLGKRAAKPHTGGHLYFNFPKSTLDSDEPETYPAIYAFADGIVTRVDEAFRLQPVYFPSLGTTRANVRYGIDVAFARSDNDPVSFHYSIEPMVDPGDLDFYQRFLLVRPGQSIRKGEIIARMYLPPERADHDNSHIHFNLIRAREFQSPSIFDSTVVNRFAADWDQQRLREDWPIPPCMGWRLDSREDPFGTE